MKKSGSARSNENISFPTAVAAIFYYYRTNRYSIHALAGAVEAAPQLMGIPLFFPEAYGSALMCLDNVLKTCRHAVFLISVHTIQAVQVRFIIRKVRQLYGERVTILAGGAHVTGLPEDILRAGADIACIGEGERVVVEVLDSINRGSKWKNVKGIAYIGDDRDVVFTGQEDNICLDEYPGIAAGHRKYGPLEITRGCVHGCAYCQASYIFGRTLRHRSVNNIIEAEQIMFSRGLTSFRAVTPDAFMYGSTDGITINYPQIELLLSELYRILKPRGKIFFGTFPSEVRPENVNNKTVGMIKKYTDNDNLVIGAQTGSGRMLELCRRGHTVSDVINAVKTTVTAGLTPNVDFIFGLPEETEKDIDDTLKVIDDIVQLGARVHAHTFMPLPQTPFAKYPTGIIVPKVQALINRLTAKGVLYGEWMHQRKV
ncbi:MAG: TIGR04013 family B12-binding domain/radical SAM domain-containing protein [Elusimicrobiota bacterium]